MISQLYKYNTNTTIRERKKSLDYITQLNLEGSAILNTMIEHKRSVD